MCDVTQLAEQYYDVDDDEDENCHDANNSHIQDIHLGGIVYKNYQFHKSGVVKRGVVYYRCAQKRRYKCKATININSLGVIKPNVYEHNHQPKPKPSTLFAGLLK